MRTRLIIASNRLPVNIIEEAGGGLAIGRSIGGLATALDAIFQRYEPFWVGWTGIRRVLSKEELTHLNLHKRLIPVQADVELIEAHYDRISNSVLWPVLHHLAPHYDPPESDWDAYREMANHFAQAIKKIVRPGDVIWLHDYQLMFVPKALRALGVDNRLGFFCHTPFPDAEHIVNISHYREILANLCEVDLLGLQTDSDVDRFWDSLRALHAGEQPGLVRAFPIGIDYAGYRKRANEAATDEILANIKATLGDRRIILSISRLDYTKGIADQLRIVERFLERTPDREQYVYKLGVAPSRETVPEYAQLRDSIQKLADRINARLSTPTWTPIEYEYHNFSFEEITAWFRAAEVALLTPHFDGMNLIAKEFIAARHAPAGLIISTGIGSALQLKEALQIPPHDIAAGAQALETAFTMDRKEKETRWDALCDHVRDENVFWWADHFLKALSKD